MTSIDMPIRHPSQFFIGGRWINPSSSQTIAVVTPSSEEVFGYFAAAQEPDINAAVNAARDAFDYGPWPRMSYKDRAEVLKAVGGQLTSRSKESGHIWTSEVGLVRMLAEAVAPTLGGIYEYYSSLADNFPFFERHKPMAGGNVGLLVREPVGVVAAIIPWNSPPMTMAYKIAPALLAGCTVIVKSSPEAPGAAYLMAEIMEAVGLPKGVFNVVTAERDVSEILVRHSGVDKITFTGSSAAGKRIGAICAERVARCTLELGGKSAAVILDDYDVEVVAKAISGSTRIMCGQICSSLTRVIVPREKHDALVEALAADFSAIRVGNPFDVNIDMGPLATRQQRDRVETYIAKGREEGATLASGGARPRHLTRGFYIEPTIFGHVDNSMTVAREEIFGPVVSVIPADSEEHAIDIANDSVYGLNASVFTQDSERAYRVSRRLRSGTVGHNAFRTDFSIAFGGFKQSGIGREGGREGVYPFLETKTIILDEEPAALE